MGLYKRGEVWWFRFQHKGTEYRGSTGQTEKRAAEAFEKGKRREVSLAGPATRQVNRPLTLGEAAASWWSTRASHLRSAVTTAYRLETVRTCIDFNTPVSDVSALMISAAIDIRRRQPIKKRGKQIKKLPTPATVNRDVIDATLRPILNHAEVVLGERIQRIPWKDLRLKERKTRVYTFSEAKLEAYFEELLPHYRELAAFFLRYGCRLREAWFDLDDFDPETGFITLRERKGGKDHRIKLIENDRRSMAAKASRARAAGLRTVWFRDTKSGLQPVRPGAYQTASKKALKACGMDEARPAHDMRHHAATSLLKSKGNLKIVQRLLGHESVVTTSRYAHVSDDDVNDALEAMVAETRHIDPAQGAQAVEGKKSSSGT